MNQLLKMLGADTEEQAAETLTQYMTFLSDVRVALRTEKCEPAEILTELRSHMTILESATGKVGFAAMREAASWKDGGARATAATWNGKAYTELSGPEKVKLKNENPALFASMRKAAGFKD